MKKEKIVNSKDNMKNTQPVSSPFLQEKLVSKVNSLTSNNINILVNTQNKIHNSEKNLSLDYNFVIRELVKINGISNLNEFYSKIYS